MPKVYQLNYDENFVSEKELVSLAAARGKSKFFLLNSSPSYQHPGIKNRTMKWIQSSRSIF